MVANMASRKRRYPKRELSLMEAFEHVNNRTFHTLHTPPPEIMWNVIKEIPFAVTVMPQATREMQLYALRNRGQLLTRPVDWKFDVERLFPGSSAWIERYRQDILKLAQNYPQKNEEGKHAIELTWAPIRTLSMRKEATIGPEVRQLLRDLPNELTESYLMALAALPLHSLAPPMALNESVCSSSGLFDVTY